MLTSLCFRVQAGRWYQQVLDVRILPTILRRRHQDRTLSPPPPRLALTHAPEQVLQRCYMTMFPPRATSYQGAYLSPAADLYGPFWTLTTLIFALFVCSSLSSAIASWLSNPAAAAHIVYDFSLIFTGTSLVYAYGLLVPVLLWFGLRYLGVGEWSVVDAVAIWGYGQFVWIPVAVSVGGVVLVVFG